MEGEVPRPNRDTLLAAERTVCVVHKAVNASCINNFRMAILRAMTAKAIARLRKRLKISQAEMAERLGVDQATVSRLERRGKPSGPVLKLLQQMAAAA